MPESYQEKYLNKIFKDLSLKNLTDQDRQEVLESLSGRFNNVILIVLLKSLSVERKAKLLTILKQSPEGLEREVEQAVSQILGFKEALESALAKEYEEIVREMNS